MTKQLWASIDPGDVHVGYTLWDGEEQVTCVELSPLGLLLALELDEPKLLVVEEFRLYPDKARTLTGTTLQTSQLVGALHWWAWQNEVPVVLQPAGVKEPTEAYVKRHGLERNSKGHGGHAKDSETHGYQYLIRGRGRPLPPARGGDLFRA